jgi:hypothetical protein
LAPVTKVSLGQKGQDTQDSAIIILSVDEPTHKIQRNALPLFSLPCRAQKEYFHSSSTFPFLLEGKVVSIFSWSQFFEGLGFRASVSWSLLPALPVRGAPIETFGYPWTHLEGGALRMVVMQDQDHPLSRLQLKGGASIPKGVQYEVLRWTLMTHVAGC